MWVARLVVVGFCKKIKLKKNNNNKSKLILDSSLKADDVEEYKLQEVLLVCVFYTCNTITNIFSSDLTVNKYTDIFF